MCIITRSFNNSFNNQLPYIKRGNTFFWIIMFLGNRIQNIWYGKLNCTYTRLVNQKGEHSLWQKSMGSNRKNELYEL